MLIRMQTVNLFDPSLKRVCSSFGPAARVPAAKWTYRRASDMSIRPPAALFDAVYASAVLHHFGSAVTDITETWEDVFYPAGFTKAAT